MLTSEKISQHVKKLPDTLQTEVLDFVEYLLTKIAQDDLAWSNFSLDNAMRDMEDKPMPTYTLADLKVVFA
ncbi:MAG: DUF2281 domain-containing protein [Chloroflexi bacterium]|nr:DUF2281 domain-containing protein [Chloroflexota bacterium]